MSSALARRPKRRLRRYSGAGDVRGYNGIAELPLLPIAIGLGVLGVLLLNKDTIVATATKAIGEVFDYAKAAAFRLALPPALAQYATAILLSAQKYGVDPWALAGIMNTESRGGTATPYYRPVGPAGTGDFTPRASTHATFRYADPATGLPPDGKGWGRGLMQVDYGVHHDWVINHAWYDAQTNIDKGAEILKANLDYFRKPSQGAIAVEAWRVLRGNSSIGIEAWATKYPRNTPWPTSVRDVRPLAGQQLYEAAIASYNVSYTGVLQALGLGLPAEAGTARQDYVSTFLNAVAGWKAKFK